MSDKKENMKLWNSVCETPPHITKSVGTRGGFTAIDAQSQIKRATEEWGMYGDKWGVKNLHFEYIGNDAENPIEITLTGVFFYPDAEFEISTDMKYYPGNDSRKKLLTDLTTKALSKLGFNSDVFEGKFDDNKYVERLKKKYDNSEEAKIPDPTEAEQAVLDAIHDALIDSADGKTLDPLKIRGQVYTLKSKYPTDIEKAAAVAKYLLGKVGIERLVKN